MKPITASAAAPIGVIARVRSVRASCALAMAWTALFSVTSFAGEAGTSISHASDMASANAITQGSGDRPQGKERAGTEPALSVTDVLACGQSRVSIKTMCSTNADGAPPRCHQELTFKAESGTRRSAKYRPRPTRISDEPFVNRLSCKRVHDNFYVVAYSGNFSNCAICEWMDVYSTNGKLLGSTPSIHRALALPPKKLPRSLERLLEHSQEAGAISIDRNHLEKQGAHDDKLQPLR